MLKSSVSDKKRWKGLQTISSLPRGAPEIFLCAVKTLSFLTSLKQDEKTRLGNQKNQFQVLAWWLSVCATYWSVSLWVFRSEVCVDGFRRVCGGRRVGRGRRWRAFLGKYIRMSGWWFSVHLQSIRITQETQKIKIKINHKPPIGVLKLLWAACPDFRIFKRFPRWI